MTCPNKEAGCSWVGSYDTLRSHVENDCVATFKRCDKCGNCISRDGSLSIVPSLARCVCENMKKLQCPFCPMLLDRADFREHTRTCQLDQKGATSTSSSLSSSSLSSTSMNRDTGMLCPDCSASLEDEDDLADHRALSCPNAVVACPCSAESSDELEEGCSAPRMLRSEIEAHLQTNIAAHLKWYVCLYI